MGWKSQLALVVVALTQMGAGYAWEVYPGLQGPGHAGMVVGDFDGNGNREVAVTGYTRRAYPLNGSDLVAVLGEDDAGALGIRDVVMLPYGPIRTLVAAPRETDGDRLAVVIGSGRANAAVVILGGSPLRIQRTISIPFLYEIAAIADVDGDGPPEIVALTGADSIPSLRPALFDYATGQQLWSSNEFASALGVAQLDADPALELVLAGTPGRILDGATRAVEWTWPAGFEGAIKVGRFGDAGESGFAVVSPWWPGSVQVFRSQPYSPVREYTRTDDGAIRTAETVRFAEGDRDQLAIVQEGRGQLHIYEAFSAERLFFLEDHSFTQAQALRIDDLGPGHRRSLVYSFDLQVTSGAVLRVMDLATLETRYEQKEEHGPYAALARSGATSDLGDVVTYLTVGSLEPGQGSTLYVLEAASGRQLRSRTAAIPANPVIIPSVAFARSSTQFSDIAVAGGGWQRGEVAMLDGTTLQDRWRTEDARFAQPIQALAAHDVNGDGSDDVVVVTGAGDVSVLDGRDGRTLRNFDGPQDIQVQNLAVFDLAPGQPVAAVSSGGELRLYDLSSGVRIATRALQSPIVALRQWGDGSECRIAALSATARLNVLRCPNLTQVRLQTLPDGSVFFHPLDVRGDRFVAAAGAYLYEVGAEGRRSIMAGPLGAQLGAGNRGEVHAEYGGQHFDVTIGSDHMVTRIRIGLDELFQDGFD